MPSNEIILPVITLVAWSMVMWIWMYATRIPAALKMGLEFDKHAPIPQQMSTLPSEARWKADNYNHLMEQPTIFYALAISLALLGVGEGIAVYLAWGYVVCRVLHSLVQALVNNINMRSSLFFLSNGFLFALTFIALRAACS